MREIDLIEGEDYCVTYAPGHYFPDGSTVTFIGYDEDGDAAFIGQDATGQRLEQCLSADLVEPTPAAQTARMVEHLKMAYGQGLRHSHEGGRIEIHLGTEVVTYLKSLCTVPDPLALASGMIGKTCWGFPVIEHPAPLHVSIHVVHDIN